MSPRRASASRRPPSPSASIHEDRPGALPAILAALAARRRHRPHAEHGPPPRRGRRRRRPRSRPRSRSRALDEAAVDAAIAARARRPRAPRDPRPRPDLRQARSSSSAAAPRSPRSPSAPSARPTATTCAASGSRSTRSRSSARRTSPAPSGRSPTCPGRACLVLAGSIMGGDISRAADELRARRHPGHRPQHGRLDHRPRRPRRHATRSRPARWRSWRSPTRPPSTSPASAAGGTERRPEPMRIATWNVNSLKARLEKVEWWLERAAPDVLLHAGDEALRRRRARSCPSGWPATSCSTTARDAGTASRSRAGSGSRTSSRTSATGRCARRRAGGGRRRVAARRTSTRSTRPGWSAPSAAASASSASTPRTGASSDSPFYDGKLAWFERLRALARRDAATRRAPLVIGGDFNVAPDRRGRLGRGRRARRHARLRAGAGRVPGAPRLGPRRRLARAPTRAPALHLVGLPGRQLPAQRGDADRPPPRRRAPVAARIVAVEIDREARKGKPVPSDHAPLVIDLDEPGHAVRPRLGGLGRALRRAPGRAEGLTRPAASAADADARAAHGRLGLDSGRAAAVAAAAHDPQRDRLDRQRERRGQEERRGDPERHDRQVDHDAEGGRPEQPRPAGRAGRRSPPPAPRGAG